MTYEEAIFDTSNELLAGIIDNSNDIRFLLRRLNELPETEETVILNQQRLLIYQKYDLDLEKSTIRFALENGSLISIQHIKDKLDELAGADQAEDAEDAVQDSAEAGVDALQSMTTAGAVFSSVAGAIFGALGGSALAIPSMIEAAATREAVIALMKFLQVIDDQLKVQDDVIKVYSRDLMDGENLGFGQDMNYTYDLEIVTLPNGCNVNQWTTRLLGEQILTLGEALTEAELNEYVFGSNYELQTLKEYKNIFKG